MLCGIKNFSIDCYSLMNTGGVLPLFEDLQPKQAPFTSMPEVRTIAFALPVDHAVDSVYAIKFLVGGSGVSNVLRGGIHGGVVNQRGDVVLFSISRGEIPFRRHDPHQIDFAVLFKETGLFLNILFAEERFLKNNSRYTRWSASRDQVLLEIEEQRKEFSEPHHQQARRLR